MISIEKFNIKYLDDVYKIECACFAHPWSKKDLENQLSLDTSHFLVALENEKAVGYMGLQIFSGEGYVTNVIFAEFENEMDFITLEVRKSNTPAIRLYEKAGFENVGIRPHFYTSPDEDAVIMTKSFEKGENI